MILFFSGTGNSQYAARIIAEKTNDEIVSINTLLKQKTPKTLHSPSKPYIFVCPTYAWQIPHVVKDFIEATDFTGNNECYLIMTCGGFTANAVGHFHRLCDKKGLVLKGFAEIIMPDNYIFMTTGMEKEIAKQIVQKATVQINEIADIIKNETAFPDFIPNRKIMSGIINGIFYSLFIKAKGFHTNEKCSGCGKCEQLCPLNNIEMHNNKPCWNKNCTHCMACISSCPTGAIEYRKKTQGKIRYYLETP